MWLSETDLYRLTGAIRPAWQIKRLIKMGIPFVKSGIGLPLVRPEDIKETSNEPNFKRIAKVGKA